MIKKHTYIRSKKLLEAAREIPCQHCYVEDGTVVAAHTNWGGGKGMGRKADDNLIASLCFTCHASIDQGSTLTREQRQDLWQMAHRKTVQRLVSAKLWPQDVPVPDLRRYYELE
jgi:hypothetical protein